MVDDPSSCPDEFPTIEDQAIERKRLHDIITRLVKWENSNDPELLAQARLEIAKSIARQPNKPPIPDSTTQPATPDRHCGLDPQSRGAAGDAGEQDKPTTPEDRHTGFKAVSTAAATGDAGEKQDNTTTPEDRHCGLDPQSRGAETGQGDNKTTQPYPLSLDGRGIKGEGENDAPTCHSEQSEESTQPTKSPSPLMGEESKVRVKNDKSSHNPQTILQYLAKHAPTIYDPFCGGGSIPLEAQRLGMKAVGSDLNPVAVLITKALIEIPPKFANKPPVNPDADPMGMTVGKGKSKKKLPWRGAAGLADDIRYYGKWMREEAFKRIGHLYPTIKDQNGIERTVIAWLWCRTVPCANPACGIKMPLKTTFQLSKKAKNRHWTKPVVDRETNTISFHVQNHPTDVPTETTVNRNGATCIACKSTVKLDYVRQQAREGKMSEQMTAVVAEGDKKRLFISPTDEHVQTALSAEPEWRPYQTMPDDPTLVSGRGYSVTHWHQLFTERQLLTLTTFSDLVSKVRLQIIEHSDDGDYANAICTYLTLAIGRVANSGSSYTRWQNSGDKVAGVFDRQAIGMMWDFAETNAFSTQTQNWSAQIEWVAKAVEHTPAESNPGKTLQADASTTVHANDAPIIVTDPPYYDNISYAILSDFFYIWLRPLLRDTYPELLASMLTPKNEEMIADQRFDDPEQRFEQGLSQTLKLIREHCTDDYPSSIFYAYKQQEEERDGQTSTGWETMLNALVKSGFHIIGTWPIRTERSARSNAMGTNSLASSVILVCRPRPEDAPSITRQKFLNELANEMPDALDQLTHEGHIAPTDLAQSAIGPGMEIYSKYSSVTYISGKPFTVKDALIAINSEVHKYDERESGDLDPESQFCVTWLNQHGFDKGDYGAANVAAQAKNIDVRNLADFHDILTAESGNVQLHNIHYYAPVDYDYEAPIDDRDGNMTAWEGCLRMAYHMDYHREDAGGIYGSAIVYNAKGSYTDRIERLARILYNYHDARGEAHRAYVFNSIVTQWNDIFFEAQKRLRAQQQTLT